MGFVHTAVSLAVSVFLFVGGCGLAFGSPAVLGSAILPFILGVVSTVQNVVVLCSGGSLDTVVPASISVWTFLPVSVLLVIIRLYILGPAFKVRIQHTSGDCFWRGGDRGGRGSGE